MDAGKAMNPSIDHRFLAAPILAIESSCDETAAAVVQGRNVLSNIVASQCELHAETGGVVPEVAARAHVESIAPVIRLALAEAGLALRDLGGVAVTHQPGLVGSLSIGVSAAKAIAFAHRIRLIGVNHLEGHLLSPLACNPPPPFPHVCLLVSGGHTEIVLVRDLGDYKLLGSTRDDAAGEAFDKSARLLGIPYPGGAQLSAMAGNGKTSRFALPRGLERESTFDFSFSGLKTAVRRIVETEGAGLIASELAASIEESIVSILAERTISAAIEHRVRCVTVCGGVAANARLRERLASSTDREGIRFLPAPLDLCGDNAAMIGIAGSFHLECGTSSDWALECRSNAPIGAVNS